MKRLVIFALLLSFALIGCSDSNQSGEKKNTVAATELTDKYKVDSKTEESNMGELTASISYPVVSELVDKNIESLVNKVIDAKISRYRELIPKVEELGESQKVTFEVTYKTKEKLSIRLNYESSMENMVTDKIIDSINIDLVYGNALELKDLFKDKGFEKKLSSIMSSQVKDKGVTLTSEFKGDANGRGFHLKDNALVLYYQSLTYTSIEDGPLEFEIPFEEIKDILKDEFLLEKQAINIIDDYNKIIDEKTKPFEALFFIQNNIKNLSEEQAATLVLGLEEIQEKYISIYEESLSAESMQKELIDVFDYNFDPEKISEIKSEELRSLVREILDGGYMIINIDGLYMLSYDYTRLEHFGKHLPKDLEQYIKFKAEESKNLKAYKTDFFIGWDTIAGKIIEAEKFLGSFPDSLKESDMNELYFDYLYQYLFGFDNAPTFDYETNKINRELVESYRKFTADNQNSETGKLIGMYLKLLEDNDYELCHEVQIFREDAVRGFVAE
ncbi:MAG: hypothetical protein GX660_14960 [Clostridiaceae bacterium]|nr:hypothetical protein [Clostridiaceae bacterium]